MTRDPSGQDRRSSRGRSLCGRVLGALAVLLAAVASSASPPLPEGSLYDERLRWSDDSGNRTELSEFRGRPVILTMFYSNCSATCLVTLGKLREIEKELEHRGVAAEFVLVSYDARLDDPRTLALYREKEKLPPETWHLLAGSERSVRRLANRIGLGNYRDLGEHIAHSFRILLLDEDGVARKALDPFHARAASLFDPEPTASTP